MPGTVYQWNVSCLPEEGGFWSEVSTFIHTTQTDVPASQPEVHPGSFLQVDCEEDNCRGILLFWKAVPAHLRNGPITEYHIFVEDTDIGNETDITVTNMTQTSLELRLEPNNTYQVQTSACTEVGCSTKSKHITIAPQGKGVSPPQDFTVEFMTDEEPGNFNINWQPLHTRVVSYTIYWCMRGENTTNSTTPLDWTTVAPNTTEYNLTLPGLSENTTQDYMVGISAEVIMTSSRTRRASDASQVTSSGISWSQCLHISGNIPAAAPEVLHMTSDPSTASIDMEWQKLSCLETPSVLTGVLVVYCVVDGGDTCTGPEQSQMAVGRGSSYTLKDLDTGHTYLIKVCGVSAAGNGPFSAPVKVDLKAYLALMYTVLIVASVLLLLLFIFFCIIWGCCKIQENTKLEISYPKNKLQLLQHCDYVDMPTTHPESSTSGKNGTYRKSGTDKERDLDQELEDTKLLPSESYRDIASIRMRESLGPKRTHSCYMGSSAKKSSLEVKPINREKIGFTQPSDTADPAYVIVAVHGEDIPREQLSSFRSHLPLP
ncbi:oncostatin-M-specific receptor subunit beta-like [Haliotis rubra]|uniref:oncostatin-M-specific receptor subunit beta-like n=1 Tax=Haliotis rubra TaxID=36100 RepID=UPI001EE51CEC|nr:oncostatin-M-specific receptor subunit beta-like [Haliotis rubra]